MRRRAARACGLVLLALAALPAAAQGGAPPGGKFDRGVPVQPATIYISPGTTAAKLGTIPRGRETHILESSPGWLHVFVMSEQGKDVSGWIEDKGMVRATTANGDRILYGEAVDSEAEAQKRHGRKGAAIDAARLYMRVTELFPNSPLAPEAHYRAADIVWQIDYQDVFSRSSGRQQDPRGRTEIAEDEMKRVRKKYPGTKWADLADYALIDNKVCGDWKGESRCPEKESGLYAKYAEEHPKSPKAAEALYNAAWRQSALIEIYKAEGDGGKSAGAKAKATALAQRLASTYPESDYAARAQRLLFLMEQGLPTYGSTSE